MYFSIAVAIWGAFDLRAAAITMVALLATIPWLWLKVRMVITVSTSELRIDRAHIELKYLKDAQVVDKAQYQKLRSVNSDARSFHATRFWAKTGVQVSINDERDKTTYWLIGCKNGSELIDALNN